MLELDVTDESHLAGLEAAVREHVDGLDGVVHSIAFGNPETLLGGEVPHRPVAGRGAGGAGVGVLLMSLTQACRPLMADGGSVVRLTFDASVAWPAYDWMGVAKAGLESCARYLARDLGPEGIRVNLVSAGPLKTLAAKAIPGVRGPRGAVEHPRAAGLGQHRPGADGEGGVRPALRLLPGDERRDRARGRRLPRHGRLTLVRLRRCARVDPWIWLSTLAACSWYDAPREAEQMGPTDFDRAWPRAVMPTRREAGSWLSGHGFSPDRALVSAALRTRETWAAVADGGGWDLDADLDRGLYSAEPDTAIDLVSRLTTRYGGSC